MRYVWKNISSTAPNEAYILFRISPPSLIRDILGLQYSGLDIRLVLLGIDTTYTVANWRPPTNATSEGDFEIGHSREALELDILGTFWGWALWWWAL